MSEGRKREVRRLFAAIGLEVHDLVRIAVGPLELGSLPEGEARPLRETELASLRAAAGLPTGTRGTRAASSRRAP